MISLKNTLKAITSKFTALNTLLNDVPHYTLLWTNPKPTSEFAAQTISLDLSKYDAVQIVANRWGQTASGYQLGSFLIADKDKKYALSVGSGEYMNYRYVTLTDTGVVFGAGGRYTTYGGSAQTVNQSCVPYKIYGIKFGGGYNLKALLSLARKEVAL